MTMPIENRRLPTTRDIPDFLRPTSLGGQGTELKAHAGKRFVHLDRATYELRQNRQLPAYVQRFAQEDQAAQGPMVNGGAAAAAITAAGLVAGVLLLGAPLDQAELPVRIDMEPLEPASINLPNRSLDALGQIAQQGVENAEVRTVGKQTIGTGDEAYRFQKDKGSIDIAGYDRKSRDTYPRNNYFRNGQTVGTRQDIGPDGSYSTFLGQARRAPEIGGSLPQFVPVLSQK
jgi:hypothetical protein